MADMLITVQRIFGLPSEAPHEDGAPRPDIFVREEREGDHVSNCTLFVPVDNFDVLNIIEEETGWELGDDEDDCRCFIVVAEFEVVLEEIEAFFEAYGTVEQA